MAITGLFVGLTTIDIQYFVDRFPYSNVKVKSNPPELMVGGPSTNAAVAFSFLGGNAVLASAVGENSFKPFIHDDFYKTDISHFDLVKEKAFNPVLATVITSNVNGDRNIFTHNPDDIISEISADEILNTVNPDIIVIDGFYPGFALRIISQAQNLKIPVILDGGSWKVQHSNLLPYVDYLICSENYFPPGCSNSSEVFEFLKKIEIKFMAITRGGKPILCNSGENNFEIEILKPKIVDTLGAGDFLHGAFAYYISDNNHFKESLKKASLLATTACKYPGTRKWLNNIK